MTLPTTPSWSMKGNKVLSEHLLNETHDYAMTFIVRMVDDDNHDNHGVE